MRPKSSAPRALNILLAEDDPNDVRLLNFALAKGGINGVSARFALARDGEEVLEYLQGEKRFVDRDQFPFPDLVILDLNMPKMNGMEVLKWLRANADWARLPVVILSGSGLEQDVEEAYELGVNSYFQKPNSVFGLASLLKTLTMYWQLTERPAMRKTVEKGRTVPESGRIRVSEFDVLDLKMPVMSGFEVPASVENAGGELEAHATASARPEASC